MKMNWKSRIVIALAVMHLTFLLAYSIPDRLVPERLRVIAQLYVRPLFHQQWKLFAPDPPLCSCEIEWSTNGIEWRPIEAGHYLEKRMVQHLARHAQAALRSENGIIDPLLIEAMRSAESEEQMDVIFRLKEKCVIEPETPADRETRITPIGS